MLDAYRYGFQGYEDDKEIKGEGNHYDFGDYGLDSRIARRFQRDPIVKRHESSYATFANDPIWFKDPTGLDTLKIGLDNNGKYKITDRILAKGDDVFQVINGGELVYSYTFKSSSKDEKRISALNLESNQDYTLGVYNVSGSGEEDEEPGEGSYGFYVLPGGEPSTSVRSNKRLPNGDYYLTGSPDKSGNKYVKWRTPWVYSKENKEVINRGVKWHPALSKTANTWTKGCFVIFPSYKLGTDCSIKVVPVHSLIQSMNFIESSLGGELKESRKIGKYWRVRSEFAKQEISTLNLRSLWNE